MEIKKTIAVAALICIMQTCPAQKIWEHRKGCIRTQGNIAGGYLFHQKQWMPYFAGDLDYYLENQVSAGGSFWCSLLFSKQQKPGVKLNTAVFGGMNYHFTKKGRFDPFIDLQPGFGLVNVAYTQGDVLKQTGYTPVPLLSATVGCNYYVGSIFLFFAKVQGLTGQIFREMPRPARLDELRISAGWAGTFGYGN